MYYSLDFVATYTRTRYTFQIESFKQKGWVKMRMVSIERIGEHEMFVMYDPAVHTPKANHCMSYPYSGRIKSKRVRQPEYSILFDGTTFNLTPSENIVRLT